MAEDDTKRGMAGPARHVNTSRAPWRDGPRGIGTLLPTVTRPAFRKHNAGAAQILADWEVIVGPKVASMTTPRRLDRGVLTIGCAGPVAMTLHYEGVALINRINAHMGGQPVHTLRLTQAGMPRKPVSAPALPTEAILEAEAAVGDFPEGELRSALASLGRVVLGRSKHSTRRLKKL
jgi:hypothetical protein